MTPLFCNKCGNAVPEQTQFCPYCGNNLMTSAQPQYQQPQQPVQQPVQQPQQYQQPPQQPVQQYQQSPQQGSQQPQPQYQQPQPQYQQPQQQYPQPPQADNGGGNNKMWIIALLAGLLIAAAAAGGWWYFFRQSNNEDVAMTGDSIEVPIDSTTVMLDSTSIEPVMVVTQDIPLSNGTFTVEDCPTTYDGVEIVLKKSDGMVKSAKFIYEGEEWQTLNMEGGSVNYYDGADLVHFLDANYDGNVDLLIGIGAARNYSALYLWNKDNQKFVRATENGDKELNADYFFAPKEKSVYAAYSMGGGMTITSRLEWDGTDMRRVESFFQMERWRYHEFPELNITHHYNVVNRNNNRIIFSTDDPDEVPARWRKWVYEEYANEDPEPGAPIED